MEPENPRFGAFSDSNKYQLECPLFPFVDSPPDRDGLAGRLYTTCEYGIMVTPDWTKLKTHESSDAWRDALCEKVEKLVGDQYVTPYRFFFGCALVLSTHPALQTLIPDQGDSVRLWHPPSFAISNDKDTTTSQELTVEETRAAFSALFLPVGHVG